LKKVSAQSNSISSYKCILPCRSCPSGTPQIELSFIACVSKNGRGARLVGSRSRSIWRTYRRALGSKRLQRRLKLLMNFRIKRFSCVEDSITTIINALVGSMAPGTPIRTDIISCLSLCWFNNIPQLIRLFIRMTHHDGVSQRNDCPPHQAYPDNRPTSYHTTPSDLALPALHQASAHSHSDT
jgi:hypothetical protein